MRWYIGKEARSAKLVVTIAYPLYSQLVNAKIADNSDVTWLLSSHYCEYLFLFIYFILFWFTTQTKVELQYSNYTCFQCYVHINYLSSCHLSTCYVTWSKCKHKWLLYGRPRLLVMKDGFIWHQTKARSIKKTFCDWLLWMFTFNSSTGSHYWEPIEYTKIVWVIP